MDLLAYVYPVKSSSNCYYCNCRRFKTKDWSYFMHSLAVFVVLLFSLNFCFALQERNVPTHPKLTLSTGIPSTVKNEDIALNENQRELQSPVDFFKDVKQDEIADSLLSPESKGLFFGEDANGVPIVVGTWFRYGSYTLAFCMFGTAFLVACVASAIYYVLFVVTEPSQQVRSMDSDEGWNVGRILRALQLAYETYETFDLYSPSCQLKALCEIQESGHFQGTLVKRLTHFIIHSDLVQKKMANAADLQAADRIGNDPEQTCTEKFAECRFSLNKLYENYVTM